MPELTVVCDPLPFDIHLRSIPYLGMFDWFTLSDPPTVPYDRSYQSIWDEAYKGPGRAIFPDVMGFDYFMSYNGRINSGGWIEEDDLECDWYPPMNSEPENLIAYFQEKFGRFIALFWPFYGSHQPHVSLIDSIGSALRSFVAASGLTPVFIGAEWDMPATQNGPVLELVRSIPHAVDHIGKTTLNESFALLMAAELVTGFHTGLTQMAAVFGTKTLLLWDDTYPESTAYACVPPAVRHSTYHAVRTRALTATDYLLALEHLHAS